MPTGEEDFKWKVRIVEVEWLKATKEEKHCNREIILKRVVDSIKRLTRW